MPKRTQNIYVSMYRITLIVVLVFFAHNIFEFVNYDVLAINQQVNVFGASFWIRDIFPFYDADITNYYGEPVRMDIQTYIYRLANKIIMFCLALGMYRLIMVLNIFLSEIPGRAFRQKPYFLLVLVGLFGYEVLDFIFTAGQTGWIKQVCTVIGCFILVAIIKRDSNA